MRQTGTYRSRLVAWALLGALFMAGFVAGISMTTYGSASAAETELTATWDVYTDTLATALKLWRSGVNQPSAWVLVDDNIATTARERKFSVDINPGQTVWVRMQAVNRRRPEGDPKRYSLMTPTVPWTMPVTINAPMPPQGLKVTVSF